MILKITQNTSVIQKLQINKNSNRIISSASKSVDRESAATKPKGKGSLKNANGQKSQIKLLLNLTKEKSTEKKVTTFISIFRRIHFLFSTIYSFFTLF